MMIRAHEKRGFVGRFDRTWFRLRRTEIVCGACWTASAPLAASGLLAAADYGWELPWALRAAGLAMAGVAVLLTAGMAVVRPMRWWSQPRTAVEVERRFPNSASGSARSCNTRARKEAVAREGVLPTLVAALEEETDRRAQPLDLAVLVPRRKCVWRRRWRPLGDRHPGGGRAGLAVARPSRGPCWPRTVHPSPLEPGDVVVDQDGEVTISLAVAGRVPEDLAIYSRPARQAGRRLEQLDTEAFEPEEAEPLTSYFSAKLEKLKEPLEYWAVAGKIESPAYRISIRRPVAIRKFEVDLTPPPYTGLKPIYGARRRLRGRRRDAGPFPRRA